MALISSPRRRRRLAWATISILLVGGLVAAGIHWPNTAEQPSSVVRPGKPRVYHEPKRVKLTNASRAQALATAANFVKTAVARRHVERSWRLVSSSLRQGYTLSEWQKGEIPVVPYPVAQARWKLDYTYADTVGLQVLVFPEAGSGQRPNLFYMELKRAGDPNHRRWLVDSWTPSGVANPALQAPTAAPGRGGGGSGGLALPSLDPSVVGGGESRLGAAWLFVPLALFGIVPIVLAVFGVRNWRRSRRAERAYREHAARRPRFGTASPGQLLSGGLRTYLSSYRRRRRLAWLGGLLLVCAGIAVLISFLPSPTTRREDQIRPGAPKVLTGPPPIKLTPRVRREVDRTVDEFVRTAVLRRDLERSWRLASPDMRASTSHALWLRGELPVFPFPADPERTVWDLDFADAYEIALNVTLVPRQGSREAPQVFGVSLQPVGRGDRRRFLVGAWYPRGALSAPAGGETPQPAPPAAEELEAARRASESQIDRIWWLVPIGMLALIVVGPLAYFAVVRLREGLRRRAS